MLRPSPSLTSQLSLPARDFRKMTASRGAMAPFTRRKIIRRLFRKAIYVVYATIKLLHMKRLSALAPSEVGRLRSVFERSGGIDNFTVLRTILADLGIPITFFEIQKVTEQVGWAEGQMMQWHQLRKIVSIQKARFVKTLATDNSAESFMYLCEEGAGQREVSASRLQNAMQEFGLTVELDMFTTSSGAQSSPTVDLATFKQIVESDRTPQSPPVEGVSSAEAAGERDWWQKPATDDAWWGASSMLADRPPKSISIKKPQHKHVTETSDLLEQLEMGTSLTRPPRRDVPVTLQVFPAADSADSSHAELQLSHRSLSVAAALPLQAGLPQDLVVDSFRREGTPKHNILEGPYVEAHSINAGRVARWDCKRHVRNVRPHTAGLLKDKSFFTRMQEDLKRRCDRAASAKHRPPRTFVVDMHMPECINERVAPDPRWREHRQNADNSARLPLVLAAAPFDTRFTRANRPQSSRLTESDSRRRQLPSRPRSAAASLTPLAVTVTPQLEAVPLPTQQSHLALWTQGGNYICGNKFKQKFGV